MNNINNINMKKIRILLSVILLVVLCAALYISSGRRGGEYSETQFLFDTECTISAGGKNARAAVKAAFERTAELDALFDYYSDSSIVSKINNAEAGDEVVIDGDTASVLSVANQISEASEGAFDITIAPVKDLWNFNGEPSVPSKAAIQSALENVNYKDFTLDVEKGIFVKQNSFTKIDLGGIAKGYAADEAAKTLKENGAEYALIDFGGNVVTLGSNPKNENGIWKIGIQKPFAPTGEYGEIIEVAESAVVTSGIYERNFTENGVLYHHILDPKSGYPVENGLSSVTVVHKSSAVADGLSTACFVLGEESGRELAESFGAEVYFKYRDEHTEEQK